MSKVMQKKIKFLKKPFEYILIENLLNKSFLKKLNLELTTIEKKLTKKVMSGRYRIRNTDYNFNLLIKKKSKCYEFYKYLKDKKTYKKFSKYFSRIHFKKTNEELKKEKKWFYFDYSVSKKGYYREPHRDSDKRLLITIYAINDHPNSELYFYTYKNNDKLKKYNVRRPSPNRLKLIKKINLRKNQLIIFPNVDSLFHSVKKYKSSKKRYFCYGSYTLGEKRN
tara:strand:- start:624 stop:1292 length:669 start_codon:yes stop_codon:yes gene_type:complete